MIDPLHVQLAVVGAGPAGILAAYTAAEAGAEVTLIDENPLPGGQYYRQSPPEFKFDNPIGGMSGRTDALTVLGKLPHPRIHTIYNTKVWGIFEPHLLALTDGEQSSLIQADQVVLATGAYDRPMAFPGWTLPGVFGAGATLRLLKTQWVLPGKRILLAGLGPLQLALADALLKAGAEVVCVAEAANPVQSWRQLPKFWGHWDRLGEAATYMASLRKQHVPFLLNHAILEASGDHQVEKAKIARLDRQGAPIPGTEREFEVDAICLGYGLLPSFQLAAAFGCRLRFDDRLGWYVPYHNRNMETTREGVYVAGDVTDISGAKVAILEGQIAGLGAAHKLGLVSAASLAERLAPLYHGLERLNRLAGALQSIYAYRRGLSHLAKEDTLLCRCEEITFGQVKKSLANGAADLHQVKLATRAGMGYCQGRFCSVLIAPLIAESTGQPVSEIQPFTARPPIQPIPLRVLAGGLLSRSDK